MDLSFAERLPLADQAVLARSRHDPRAVEAGAVVFDLHDQLARLVVGAQRDRGDGVLAAGAALRRGLDAVVEGVADHRRERVAKLLDDREVGFDVSPLDGEARLLAAGDRDVANRARVLPEARAERHHPRPHDQFLHLPVEPLGVPVRLQDAAPRFAQRFEQAANLASGDGDLSGQREQPVELLEADARAGTARRANGVVPRGAFRSEPFHGHRGLRAPGDRQAGRSALQGLHQLALARSRRVIVLRRLLQDAAEQVDGLEQERHQRGRQFEAVAPQPVEEILEDVRDLGYRGEAER